MDKVQAQNLIKSTFENSFDKSDYRNFIINLLDGVDESKEFTCGNALVPEGFRKYVTSYGRLGKYLDSEGADIEVLWVSLKKETSLERARTVQRNFIAWYLNGGRGGVLRHNALVAFYNETVSDWRFSFVKLDVGLKQDETGKIKVINEFTPAKRYSFLVGELEPNHTAQSRLVGLLTKDYPLVSEIEEAFNVEKVSKEFFANYKELFLQLVDNLKEIRANDKRINVEFTLKSITEANFCKKLLGQLVFLYFIQKKGWLGVPVGKKWGEGDKQFLRHTFERAVREGKNFFNDYLEHLFYDALANGERDEQYFSMLDCKIPFLNGGLFETICGYDWVNTDIVFENDIFSNNIKTKNGDIGTGILDVFDRYNFTVKEDEPLEKEVAVDPEMLGKVFEELLEVQDRKSKGAFYTPREIVHYMCQESLINYLVTELGAIDSCHCEEQSDAAIQANCNSERQIDLCVSESNQITKQEIADFIHHSDKLTERESIATQKENQNSKYTHILSENIKNNAEKIDKALETIKICDPAIGSGAFPVGMLNEIVRARIALVESGFLKKETKKRSVYEYKRQAIQNSIYGVDIESGAVEIAKLRLWLSLVVDEENIKNIKALPNLDYKIVCGNSLLGVERNVFNDGLFRQLEELKPQFFNETRKSEKKRLKKEIDAIIKELTKDGTFDFEIYFSEVFNEKGGFDVVIGNPPYVSFGLRGTGKITSEEKKYYTQKYTNSAEYKISYYAMFMELAIKLGNANGVSSYIVPDSFLLGRYFSKIRKFILKQTNIINLMLIKSEVFENASLGQSVVYLFKKGRLENHKLTVINVDSKEKIQKRTYITNQYLQNYYSDIEYNRFRMLFSAKDYSLVKKIDSSFPKLFNFLCGHTGIRSKIGQKNIIEKYKKSELYKKGIISGGQIFKYCIQYLNDYINIDKSILHGGGFDKEIIENKKILLRQTSDKIIAAIDTNGYYHLNNVHTFSPINNTCLIEYITSILNSKLMNFYYKKISLEEGRAMAQIDIEVIEKFPIPYIDKNKQNIFKLIVDKILILTQSEDYLENHEKQQVVKEYEKQIDIMVYKLYDLTYQEVITIDKDFTLSEQQYNEYKL